MQASDGSWTGAARTASTLILDCKSSRRVENAILTKRSMATDMEELRFTRRGSSSRAGIHVRAHLTRILSQTLTFSPAREPRVLNPNRTRSKLICTLYPHHRFGRSFATLRNNSFIPGSPPYSRARPKDSHPVHAECRPLGSHRPDDSRKNGAAGTRVGTLWRTVM